MIVERDKQILRELAKKQSELANSDKMRSLVREWELHGSDRASRPMLRIELNTFEDEILNPLLKCSDDYARAVEKNIYRNIFNHMNFGDDSVVPDSYTLNLPVWFIPFNVPEIRENASVDGNKGLGHHFVSQLVNLDEDFVKLGKSKVTVFEDHALREKSLIEDILGDILKVDILCGAQIVSLTQNIVHIMSMQDMFMSMYDSPELFCKMMDMLSDDYITMFEMLEAKNLLTSTTKNEWLCQGSYCYTDKLPSSRDKYLLEDIWCYMDSQETVSVSPDMFDEMIFPYYKKVADKFGLISYGCCEPVDPYYEKSISKLTNLGKISISPWANEEYMGECLRGSKTVFHRKPSPNYLGVGNVLDEEGLRQHFRKTVNAAKGCKLEFSQRDVYTVGGNVDKVRRYVEILREECDFH